MTDETLGMSDDSLTDTNLTDTNLRTTDDAGRTGSDGVALGRQPILEVRDLSVRFWVGGEWAPAAQDLSYDLHAGEVLCIVGESGSGKSQSSMALMGLLPRNGRASGSAKLRGQQLIGMPDRELQRLRGAEIAMIFQEPMTALNPVYTVGFQMVETLRAHLAIGPHEAQERVLDLMRLVELPDPERRFKHYPHQLSGGQLQRVMIAQALSCDPKLLIADEPTTALDVTVQAEILKLMRDLRSRVDAGIILITHNMGVVADMADRILVMRRGKLVEHGTSAEIFSHPQQDYTKALLAAVPHLGEHSPVSTDERRKPTSEAGAAPTGPTDDTAALVLEDVAIEYPKQGRTPAFRAAEGISLTVAAGEVVGLVGESGSGKTTIGRASVGLLPVAGGRLVVAGHDITRASRKDLRKIRADTGIVFQDPASSLNPRLPIGESIGEPLYLHDKLKGSALNRRVESLLDNVQLPRSMRNRYPHELSGGQRQRVGIARSLALEPKLLVADEPTSALDVSVQAKVLELLGALQKEHGFGCLFISHDLAVVELMSTRIAVMRKGQLVEIGDTAQIITDPQQPYTQRLLAAVPVPDPEEQANRRAARDALLEAEAAQP
jgi:peptide/nickel transport system ATP-binding protein